MATESTSRVIELKGVVTFDPTKTYEDANDSLRQEQMQAAGYRPGESGVFSGGKLEAKLLPDHLSQNALQRITSKQIAEAALQLEVDSIVAKINRLVNAETGMVQKGV